MKIKPHLLALAMTLFALPAHSWKLSPEATEIEKKLVTRSHSFFERIASDLALKGVHVVGAAVHEEITNRTLGCDGESYFCSSPTLDPDNAYYIAGVRWNDDPPFQFSAGQGNFGGCKPAQTVRLVTQPQCWGNTFKDGEKRAADGKFLDGANANLLVRSHFGDMQFLHAMASKEQEPAAVTRTKILAWAEFTWRLALQEYELDTKVWTLPIEGFDGLFAHNKEWRIQDLFALGNPHVRSKSAMSRLAFGSLLHMVQDSFAEGHVDRLSPVQGRTCPEGAKHPAPGVIVEFHSYARQNSHEHGKADSREAFGSHWHSDKPNVVDVGRVLHQMYKQNTPWVAAQSYLTCVFALDADARAASSGAKFVK